MTNTNPAKRDLAEWDAEIEAEFQREVAATNRAGRLKRGVRLVAFPWAFLVDVNRLTEGRTTLNVAMYIYRRTHVCHSQTVMLPIGELGELGIDRKRRHEALTMLEAAGLVRLERMAPGRSAKVTLTWKPR
jgi:hypothetical protein